MRFFSLPNLLFLLLLLVILLAGVMAMTTEQRGFARSYAASMPASVKSFSMPVTTLVSGSAHRNVWEAINYRFLNSFPVKGGALLPLRFVAKWLAFLLPLAGFILSYSAVSREIESGVIQSLFSLPIKRAAIVLGKMIGETMAVTLTLVVGMGGALLLATRIMRLSWSVPQLTRALVFLGVMGVYVSLFIFIGTWISARTRRSTTSLWICTAITTGLFLLSALIGNVASINAFQYPPFPEMPSDVNLYLHSLPLRPIPQPTQVPGYVQAYMEKLRNHADIVAREISARYQSERWWNFLSPAQLALEVAGQLLQDGYRSAVDVFNVNRSKTDSASLSASLGLVTPELIWLLLLCGSALLANIITLTRMEV